MEHYYAYLQFLDMLKSFCIHSYIYMHVTIDEMRLYYSLRKQNNFSRTLIIGFPIYTSQTLKGMSKKKLKSESLSHGIIICNTYSFYQRRFRFHD